MSEITEHGRQSGITRAPQDVPSRGRAVLNPGSEYSR